MDGNIKFSIMTPVYKVEPYLDECVQSVVGQSYVNFELILMDDGSPDRCGEMCDAWAERDSRIRAYHIENGGLLHARSAALEKATGDYYVFLDSDDYLYPNALETLYGKLTETGCDCVIYSSEKRLDSKVIEKAVCEKEICGRVVTDKREVLKTVLTNGSYNAIWRKCVRASCFDGRDYTPYNHIKYGEDLVRSLEIFENAGSFLFIPDILHVYRCNRESMMNTICYDDVEFDGTVESLADALIGRTGVLTEDDIDAVRNFRLDAVTVMLKNICRGCTSDAAAVKTMERLRYSRGTERDVSVGYRTGKDAQWKKKSLLRRVTSKIYIGLFSRERYRAVIAFDRLLRRAAGK